MSKLIVLGSSSAVPGKNHENTHLGLVGETRQILVDCVGNDLVRIQNANMDPLNLSDIIITHFHPDHASGLPLLLMSMWLLGRKKPINIHGLVYTLERVKKLMDLFESDKWPGFFSLDYHDVLEENMTLVFETESFRIFSSPTKHLLPTIGLRIEAVQTETVITYSCDTEPCEAVVELAKGVDILIHEATGQSIGHSSAAQAGEVAQKAAAKSLYFIHYPPQMVDSPVLIAAAKQVYSGEVRFTKDFMELAF